MNDLGKQFAQYYTRLWNQSSERGHDLPQFDEYEQETIALYGFNSDYGANGLVDYVACNGRSMLKPTLRGLRRIGADRLETIVREYFEMLDLHGFDPATDDVYYFIDERPPHVQREFDSRQAEAAGLYSDFYKRWESHYAQRVANATT